MSFIPLRISANTPRRVTNLINHHIEMQFADIHVMLRLPLAGTDLLAGCNFAAANSILALISGLSALTTQDIDTRNQSGARFREILTTYYPWDIQPTDGDTTPHGVAGTVSQLYDYFRNTLSHSLGIRSAGNYLVSINKTPLTEEFLEALERRTTSPGPAIIYSPLEINGEHIEQISLQVANFYWGVREMFYRMTNNATLMSELETTLTRLGF